MQLPSFQGPGRQSLRCYRAALHERLKKGLRLVHEIIKSPMRLKDKMREEREFSALPGAR